MSFQNYGTQQPQMPLGGQPQQGTVNLSKGSRVDLTKGNANLDRIHVGLGWDANQMVGVDFDLDASVFMVGANGLVPTSKHLVFYNEKTSPCRSVTHMGDNRTGDGDGDDEEIKVQLSQIPREVERLIFTVTIHEAIKNRQNFGQVSNAFIRIVDENTGHEIIRYNLTEGFSTELSVVVGEIYRHGTEWKFNAVGAGYVEELGTLMKRYGVN